MKFERGGVILHDGTIIELKNLVKDQIDYIESLRYELEKKDLKIEDLYPDYTFMLDPEDFLKYKSLSICFWHTHIPDSCKASKEDLLFFDNHEDYFKNFLIVGSDGIAIYTNVKYTGKINNENYGYTYDCEIFSDKRSS